MPKYLLSAVFIVSIVALFGLVMATCVYQFDEQTALLLFSEKGFLEQASPWIWLTLSLFLFWKSRGRFGRYMIFALTFLLLAGREWDLHKAFTSDSILKLNFYKDGFGTEQFFGSIVFLSLIILLTTTVTIIGRETIFKGGFKHISCQLLVVGFGLIGLSKVLDRIPSVLRKEYGVLLSFQSDLVLQSLEEGYEFFTPILIFTAFLIHFRQPVALQHPKNIS